jgi:flagellar basal body rod protein FlgG
MMIDAATETALERIAARSQDVQHAFTPGALPVFGDVAAAPASQPGADPLSAAAPPDAYFVTTDVRGRTLYTQNGTFRIDAGTLVGFNGKPVLGFTSQAAPMRELHVDRIDAALERTARARIEADGTFAYDRSVLDPRTGLRETQRVAVGRVALARFPAASNLGGGEAVVAPAGVVPHVGRAGDGNFGMLEPTRRASSRINFNAGLDRLEEAYLSFDALQAAHKAKGSFGKTAMDLLK